MGRRAQARDSRTGGTHLSVEALDWDRIARDLDAEGHAVAGQLLSVSECRTIANLYTQENLFRSRVVMARHGYGRGEYEYFAYPLPDLVAALRTTIYPHLAPIANRWNETMRIGVRYPA